MPSFLDLLQFLLLCVASVGALTFDYKHSLKISNEGRLWYTGDASAGEVHIALSLTLPMTNPKWVGLGLAAPGSTGMRGANLLTAQFNATSCTLLQARAAPFIGTPRLRLPADTVAPPLVGGIEKHGWKYRACSRDSNGTFSLEVTRKLNGTVDDTSFFLHAYGRGSTVAYHNKTKFSTPVNFFRPPKTRPLLLAPDRTGSFSLKSPKFASSKDLLTCYTGVFKPPTLANMVISMEVIVKSGGPGISRLMVYGCQEDSTFSAKNFAKIQRKCSSPAYSVGVDSEARCGTLFYSWAPGMGRLDFPKEAGLFVGALNRQIVVEVAFENSRLSPIKADHIEILFHYTDKLRKHRVGTMAAGDAAHKWVTRPAQDITVTCTDRCTRYLKEPINMFAIHMHLGRYGRNVRLEIKRKATGNFTTMENIPYWASSYERYRTYPVPVVLNPSDNLALTCNYNFDRLPANPTKGDRFTVRYGRSVNSEQCDAWIHYYPAQYRFEKDADGDLFYCAQTINDVSQAAMICGAGWRGKRALAHFRQFDPACFPAQAKVTLRDSSTKYMKDLVVGDEVLVGRRQYSRVYMFTHNDYKVRSEFVVLRFSDRSTFAASPGHLLYTATGKLLRADEVLVGNTLDTLDKQEQKVVVEIRKEERVGLYNPQTLQGDIVVDGVISSTYTSTVSPAVGHAMLSPTRLLYSFLASDTSSLVCRARSRGFLLRIRQLTMSILSSTLGGFEL